jgi:plastocyanin
MEDGSMNERLNRCAVLILVLVVTMLGGLTQLGRGAGAQEATPAGAQTGIVSAQPATPIPGAQTWHVLVNNVSPAGENWSFNTFYPDELQAHPGDTIVFTLAPNPQAFHTVQILTEWRLARTPLEFYQGYLGGFRQPDPTRPGEWQSPFFGVVDPRIPCGRVGQDPCLMPFFPQRAFGLGINSGVLVNPPPDGGDGNTSFTVTLDPALLPGPYYVLSDVDGPTMSGLINVVALDQPVQSQEALDAAAELQYQADLMALAVLDGISSPAESSNPDGTKTWQVAAGVGGENAPGLSINEFARAQLVIITGDTVTWTNQSPGAVAHTVSGFGTSHEAIPQNLSPYQPGCTTSSGETQLPPAGTFPTDVWNTCVGSEVNTFTGFSLPSAPSGDPYTGGSRTSGILLNEEYLNSPIGAGLPYASSYSVIFSEAGTYHYHCAIHPGMEGTVIVIPKPMPL